MKRAMQLWRLTAIAFVAITSLKFLELNMPASAQLILGPSVKPLFEVTTLVPQEHHAAYFEVLAEFAKVHELRIHIAPTRLHADRYTTDMLGDHIEAMGSNIRDVGVFRIAFLPALRASATHPIFVPPEETINKLRNDLRERISRVPSLRLLPE